MLDNNSQTIEKSAQKASFFDRNFKILFVLVLFFSLFVRFYWGTQKQGLHIDEVLSIITANHNGWGGLSPDENKIYSRKDFVGELFFDDSGLGDSARDIATLYHYNKDPAHTDFYYSLLRLAFLGRATFSLKNIIYTGIALNSLLFVTGFFFFYKLLQLLYKDYLLILLTLFCASVASSAVSNTLFLRPYQLQSTMLIVLTYVILKIIVEKRFNRKYFILLSFSAAGTLLSGYFTIIFIGLFSLFIFIYYSLQKDFKKIFFYGSSFLVGALIAQLLYLKYWLTIFTGQDRAGEVFQKVNFGYFISNISASIQNVYGMLTNYALYDLSLFLLVAVVLFVFFMNVVKKKKIEINWLSLYIVVICLMFSVIAIYLAPFKVIRYIMPVFPLIILIIPLTISAIGINFLKIGLSSILMILFAWNAFNVEKINYLYENKLPEANFLGSSSSLICIASPYSWRFLEWLPYAKDTQKYFPFGDPNNFSNFLEKDDSKAKCNYIIVDTMYSKDDQKNIYNAISKEYIVSNSLLTPQDDLSGFEMLETKGKNNRQ